MIVCVDLDSTLLNSEKIVTSYTRSVLDRFKKSGGILIIDSARSFSRIKPINDIIKADYIICNAGAQIFDKDEKLIYKISINNSITKEISKLLIPISSTYSVQSDRLYTSNPLYENEYVDVNSFDFDVEAYKIVLKRNKYVSKKKVMRISEKFNLEYVPYENGRWGRVSLKGVSKFSGLLRVLDLSRLNIDNVTYFGDDIGDAECIEKCGYGVAMGNGTEDAKSVCDYVCQTNDEDGVAKYINEFLLENKWSVL